MTQNINIVKVVDIQEMDVFKEIESILNCKFVFHDNMNKHEGSNEDWLILDYYMDTYRLLCNEIVYIHFHIVSLMRQWMFDKLTRRIKNYPKPGVVFKDITPLLGPSVFDILCQEFCKLLKETFFNIHQVDYFAALESRGYYLAMPMALMLNKGIIPIRKASKLPNDSHLDDNPELEISLQMYGTEYSQDTIGMISSPDYSGKKVILIDDLIATGGSLDAAKKLLNRNGMIVVGAAAVYEVEDLEKEREEKLKDLKFDTLVIRAPIIEYKEKAKLPTSESRDSLISIDKPIENLDFSDKPLLISGFGSEGLTKSIHKYSGLDLCDIKLDHFGNGETQVEINTNIRNRHVIIVCQTRSGFVNDDFMSTSLILDACERSDAGKITLVLPYYPYARSDKKDHPRVPIGAANIARILKSYNIDNIISLDLHAGQLQGLFDKGFHNLYIVNYMRDLIQERYSNLDYVLVSPDAGSIKRIEAYAKKLEKDYIILHKQRDYTKKSTIKNSIIIGEPDQYVGKVGIVIDDIADSCGTIQKAVDELVSHGMKEVIVIVTHGVLSGPAISRINSCTNIREVIVTNSLPQEENMKKCDKLYTLDAGRLITQALLAITKGESVSTLFD